MCRSRTVVDWSRGLWQTPSSGKPSPLPPSKDTTLCRLCWCCSVSSRCVRHGPVDSLGARRLPRRRVRAVVDVLLSGAERGQGEARAGGARAPAGAGARGAAGLLPQGERDHAAGVHVAVRT